MPLRCAWPACRKEGNAHKDLEHHGHKDTLEASSAPRGQRIIGHAVARRLASLHKDEVGTHVMPRIAMGGSLFEGAFSATTQNVKLTMEEGTDYITGSKADRLRQS